MPADVVAMTMASAEVRRPAGAAAGGGVAASDGPSPDAEAKGALKKTCKGPKARWKGPRVCRNQTRFKAVVADAEEGAAVVSSAVTWEEESRT